MDIMDSNNLKDTTGRWLTQALFLEKSYGSKVASPLYTMKDQDYNGLPSFTRLFLEIGDPTCWRQANELLGGWDHWKALMSSEWFREYAETLLEKLDVKLRSEAVLAMELLKSKGDFRAAQFFAKEDYKPKRAGRPSKAQVEAEARKQAEIESRVAQDAARLGLVKGNDHG